MLIELTRTGDGAVVAVNLSRFDLVVSDPDGNGCLLYRGYEDVISVKESFAEIRERVPGEFWLRLPEYYQARQGKGPRETHQ